MNDNTKKVGSLLAVAGLALVIGVGVFMAPRLRGIGAMPPATATPAAVDIEAAIQAAVQTALAAQQPMPTASATATSASSDTSAGGWQKVDLATLPQPQGYYPGWIRMVGQQQSDGLPRLVELTVRRGQIALIFGDVAEVPGMPVTKVGANNREGGCYLLVVVGPAIWDTQPANGEWSPIRWPGRSAWDLHDAESDADPFLWMAQKAHDLTQSYPATCGKGIDLWVYRP